MFLINGGLAFTQLGTHSINVKQELQRTDICGDVRAIKPDIHYQATIQSGYGCFPHFAHNSVEMPEVKMVEMVVNVIN